MTNIALWLLIITFAVCTSGLFEDINITYVFNLTRQT
jgi:hypothetical protein